jgi:hypothetical protein
MSGGCAEIRTDIPLERVQAAPLECVQAAPGPEALYQKDKDAKRGGAQWRTTDSRSWIATYT